MFNTSLTTFQTHRCYICGVKLVKQISAIVLGIVFLMSSSGFLIYKSHCSCTGNEKVSLFINSEICETEINNHNENEMESSCCSVEETTECQSHANDCDCDKPEISYFKLKNQVVNEEVKFTKVHPIQIFIVYAAVQTCLLDSSHDIETKDSYNDPPPLIETSLDFLIQIQQLKISSIA